MMWSTLKCMKPILEEKRKQTSIESHMKYKMVLDKIQDYRIKNGDAATEEHFANYDWRSDLK